MLNLHYTKTATATAYSILHSSSSFRTGCPLGSGHATWQLLLQRARENNLKRRQIKNASV